MTKIEGTPPCTLTCQYLSQSVYSVALCREKNTNFCRYLDFGIWWCRQLAAIKNVDSLTLVHDNEPSATQRHQNHFCTPTPSWWNRAHNSDVQKRDEQTDRQRTLDVFSRPGGAWNPSPTKVGMAIDNLEHVLTPLKRLGSHAVLPLGGAENLG